MNTTVLALIPVGFVVFIALLAFVWNLTGEVRELKTKIEPMWRWFWSERLSDKNRRDDE